MIQLTDETVVDLERLAQKKYWNRQSTDPRANMLLTLVQFNVFQAFFHNSKSLSFTKDWLEYDADSAFSKADGKFNQAAPPTLQPIALQCRILHHPWLDLLPFPALRDNVLRIYDVWQGEDELCGAVIGFYSPPGPRSGPWDPRGWGVTEGFWKSTDGCCPVAKT
ncbi:hypothetical protein BU23DRAFT_631936 [Bimuria novae-zelandiae CBS 107.79]|uniref:Uncharacterized protein n=1 Tax=Bimuria novae-zelandiae CBS 107.79 TaxID=1447943 RepID=A0A6A5UIB9_9PLEO|nr:hypothetical protein BU23DRAFT_631936 [Bimuria novae-zelandiae CBS 107.79]